MQPPEIAIRARFALLPPDTLHAHEEVVAHRVDELTRKLEVERVLTTPIVADEETGVVLDGHHRLTALTRLGCRRVPVHLVDYQSPAIGLDTWRDGEDPPTKGEVVERALAGDLYPPKTTRHLRLDALGEVPVRLGELE